MCTIQRLSSTRINILARYSYVLEYWRQKRFFSLNIVKWTFILTCLLVHLFPHANLWFLLYVFVLVPSNVAALVWALQESLLGKWETASCRSVEKKKITRGFSMSQRAGCAVRNKRYNIKNITLKKIQQLCN